MESAAPVCYACAPCAPTRRMHHRRTCPVGADAHIGPLGIDNKSTIGERTPRKGASESGCDIHGAGGRCTWFRADIKSAPTARMGDGAVDGLPRTRGLAGRCGHPPLRGGIIKPRRKSGAGPGGHTGRPYERTEGGSVGADYISARAHRRVGCTIALSGGRYDAMGF